MLTVKIVTQGVTAMDEWEHVEVIRPGSPVWEDWAEEHTHVEELFAFLMCSSDAGSVKLSLGGLDKCYITNHNGKTIDVVKRS